MTRDKTSRMILTERDHTLLLSLHEYECLTTSQIRTLHFPSLQTAIRRIRLLREAGYIATRSLLGVPEQMATMTPLGADAVAAYFGLTREDVDWGPPPTRVQDGILLRHRLVANNLRIALTTVSDETLDVDLRGFSICRLGGDGRHVQSARPGAAAALHRDDSEKPVRGPDAAFALRHEHAHWLFFLDIERPVEPGADQGRNLWRLLSFYDEWLRAESLRRYEREFDLDGRNASPRVLLVTACSERLSRLRRQAVELGPLARAGRAVWVGLASHIQPATLWTSRWWPLVPRQAQPRTFLDLLSAESGSRRTEPVAADESDGAVPSSTEPRP